MEGVRLERGGAMLSSERVRAWLLVRSSDPSATQASLAPLLSQNEFLHNEDVIIRADVVVGCGVDLVVPVDVRPFVGLRSVVARVRSLPGVTRVSAAQVLAHAPGLPVEAHCYIAEDEIGGAYNKGPGRYPMSPGANPWG